MKPLPYYLKENKLKIIVGIFILLLAIFIKIWALFNTSDEFSLKCPEDYASEEEYRKDLEMYLAEILKDRPDVTLKDFSQERIKFLEDNHCQKTLDHIHNTEIWSD